MILDRLKKLWSISDPTVPDKLPSEIAYHKQPKEKKMAQIVSMEDPLEVFEKDNDNN